MLRKLTFSLLAAAAFLVSCGPEAPTVENDEELITTLKLNFRNSATGELTVFRLYDEDGNGPKAPTYQQGPLAANATYTVELEVLNELSDPVENINEEIIEEAESHQFFFEPSNGLNLEYSYDDTDVNNFPLGLKAFFFTGAASNGILTVTLKHEPQKAEEGVKDGLIENAGGETDIQAVFDVTIE